MTSTPVSPLPTDRPATPAGAPREEYRVRPLPSTEPGRDDLTGAGHDPRPPEPVAAPRPASPDDVVPVPARRAAHALVIMALEVVDRQRAPHHLRGAFPPHLVEMLRVLARGGVPGQHLGPARIHRLHMHAAGPTYRPAGRAAPGLSGSSGSSGSSEAVDYEVCATYARGPRLFAVAARIRVTGTGARCTALRLV